MTATASDIPAQEAAPFSLTMEVEEDIEQEIETFVRFKRRGEYEQAEEVFQETLSRHLSIFPVIAEYADFLLVQEQYRILSEFLDIQMQYMESELEEDEMELLRIMKSLVNIHTKGLLRPALAQAKRTWDFLARRSTSMPPDTLPSDVEVCPFPPWTVVAIFTHSAETQQIHIFEIYIKIIIFALVTSNWVSPDEMKCPWAPEQHSDHCGFVLWYLVLSSNGHLWNASQVLLSLLEALPLFRANDAVALFDTHCFGDMASEGSLENLSEVDQLIACSVSFGRAQALLNLALLLYRHNSDDIQWKEVYEIAFGYNRIADLLPNLVHHHDIISVLDLRAYVQRAQFARVQEELITPKLSAPTLSPKSAFELSTEALLKQDLRCYYICYFQSALDHARGLSSHLPGRLSVPELQLHEQGNLIGFIRTCDLFCTLMVNFLEGSEARYLRAILSSEVDSFLALQLPPSSEKITLPMKGSLNRLMDQIRQVFSLEGVELAFEQFTEAASSDEEKPATFDIPLYLWAMCEDMELSSHKLSNPLINEFPRLSNEPIEGCLPRPIIRETLNHISRLVLVQSQSRIVAEEEEAHRRQDMDTLLPSQTAEPELGPIPTIAKEEPDPKEQAKAHEDSIPQQHGDKHLLDGEEFPEDILSALDWFPLARRFTDDFPVQSQAEAVEESLLPSRNELSSPYASICIELRADLMKRFQLGDDHARRFAPRGTAKRVLRGDKVLQFFRSLHLQDNVFQDLDRPPEEGFDTILAERNLHDFLAILIFSMCDIQAARKFTTKIMASESSWSRENFDVPTSRWILERLFEDRTAADQFLAHQSIFCPAVIRQGREVVIPSLDYQRLPYLEEQLISQGARGKVFKVKIAPGHFDPRGGSINQQSLDFARKDYIMTGNLRNREPSVAHDIIQSILSLEKDCKNVAESYGSLAIGSLTYSLFMPLARINLEQYMTDRYERSLMFRERADFIQNTLGLTKGLCYLHTELKSETGLRFICYDFDLKPENVLLFEEYDKDGGRYRWKLSDFGMAHVKYRKPGQAQYTTVRNVIHQRCGRLLQSISQDSLLPSTAPQYEGTYLPPESMRFIPAMDTRSDVWSLGCIISVVFTFMLEGPDGVTKYAENRAAHKKADGFDRFFLCDKGRSRPKTIHPAVKNWHRGLIAHAKALSRNKGKAVEFILKFLERAVFTKQSARCDAQTVKQKLLETWEKYQSSDESRYEKGITRVDRLFQLPQTMIRRIVTHGEERREEEEHEEQPNELDELGSLALEQLILDPGVDEMYTIPDELHPSPGRGETTPWWFRDVP